ncbi:MAG: restriction endonuclease subunit S [Synergistaceae bacterium]|nr:restriction endonuclease subunit S [Synergistaceae bacterium]
MGLISYRLGELIQIEDERNTEGKYTLDDVRGISIQKIFIDTKADMAGVSLKPYIIVRPDSFAYVPVTSRNGGKITIARNETDSTFIVSTSYIVFSVKRTDILMPDYLFMYFSRSEFDRYARFNSWGSARETFSWEDMCNIMLPVPPIEIQRKYVRVYTAMKANLKAFENGYDDLRLVCDMMLDRLKHTAPRMQIGDLLEEIDNRNTDGKYTEAHGININKEFMPSVASSDDLRRYKIVAKNQFAYSSMQTGRDECIRIALLRDDKPVIVSPAYSVLRKKSDNVLEEYLQMWFSRAETDRIGWFMSDASIRSNLDLSRLFELSIPIPDIKIQRSIANIYTVAQKRKSIAERLKALIKSACPVLIKGAINEARTMI